MRNAGGHGDVAGDPACGEFVDVERFRAVGRRADDERDDHGESRLVGGDDFNERRQDTTNAHAMLPEVSLRR